MLTPAQLKQLQLEKQENGFYSTEEVDGLLSQLTKDYSDVFAENGNVIRKLSVLASKLDEYRKDENVLRDVLLNAQKSADLIISAAQSQADEMLVDANKNVADVLRRGDGIIADANAKADKINAAAEAEYTSIISSAKVMADGYLAAARESAASVTSERFRHVRGGAQRQRPDGRLRRKSEDDAGRGAEQRRGYRPPGEGGRRKGSGRGARGSG